MSGTISNSESQQQRPTSNSSNVGKVTQVIGSTFDAEFSDDNLPAIYNAVKIQGEKGDVKLDLTGEIQQHLGGGRVRCVALGSTEGLVRGQDCVDTGQPVSVPVTRRVTRVPRRAACAVVELHVGHAL